MVMYREYSCILFGVHLFASVILAAVFTENLFLFIYTSLAGVFSPVLYADQKVGLISAIITEIFRANDFLQDFITDPSDLRRVSSESQHYYRFRHGNDIFPPQKMFINYFPLYFQLHLIIFQLLRSLSLPDWWLVDWLGGRASSDLREASSTDCDLLRHNGRLNN